MFIPNKNSPSPNVSKRLKDVNLNLPGGIGIYQTSAQIARKTNMFNILTLVPDMGASVFKYTRLEALSGAKEVFHVTA